MHTLRHHVLQKLRNYHEKMLSAVNHLFYFPLSVQIESISPLINAVCQLHPKCILSESSKVHQRYI